mmetsp:Transcript_19593/g.68129  ORF Transcript_19593/g.68129 Transcript_19593/m.68129 type:complete len:273 (+) Transcript_19593:626-1444(+)
MQVVHVGVLQHAKHEARTLTCTTPQVAILLPISPFPIISPTILASWPSWPLGLWFCSSTRQRLNLDAPLASDVSPPALQTYTPFIKQELQLFHVSVDLIKDLYRIQALRKQLGVARRHFYIRQVRKEACWCKRRPEWHLAPPSNGVHGPQQQVHEEAPIEAPLHVLRQHSARILAWPPVGASVQGREVVRTQAGVRVAACHRTQLPKTVLIVNFSSKRLAQVSHFPNAEPATPSVIKQVEQKVGCALVAVGTKHTRQRIRLAACDAHGLGIH